MRKLYFAVGAILVIFLVFYFLYKNQEAYHASLSKADIEHIADIKDQLKKANFGDIILFNNGTISVFTGHSGNTIFEFQSCLNCTESKRSYDEWNLVEIKRIIKSDDPEHGKFSSLFLMEKKYKAEK